MIDSQLLEALQIRYVKLHFTISFTEDAILPVNKVSALRGGMGEMLLRANCIRDRRCEVCDFETECIVRRTMYSKFEEKPAYITTGESVGYVLECENYVTEFLCGETLEFHLLLFGRTIVYLNQFLQAFHTLGMNGLGRGHARFQIISLTNTKKQEILRDNYVLMKNYVIHCVSDYVKYRMEKILQNGIHGILVFKTPLTLKYHNEFLQEFQMEAILNAVKRRIQMLDCFEQIQNDFYYDYQVAIPEITEQDHQFIKVRRYSSRQENQMYLKGIKGQLQMKEISDNAVLLLLAGELLHIGKNTSFGFGRYQLK